jgi:hypothetical protein
MEAQGRCEGRSGEPLDRCPDRQCAAILRGGGLGFLARQGARGKEVTAVAHAIEIAKVKRPAPWSVGKAHTQRSFSGY